VRQNETNAKHGAELPQQMRIASFRCFVRTWKPPSVLGMMRQSSKLLRGADFTLKMPQCTWVTLLMTFNSIFTTLL